MKDKQIEALQTRLSTNLLLTDDYQKSTDKQNNVYQQQIEDLNSSFLSTSSPPLSPMPHARTRIGSGKPSIESHKKKLKSRKVKKRNAKLNAKKMNYFTFHQKVKTFFKKRKLNFILNIFFFSLQGI